MYKYQVRWFVGLNFQKEQVQNVKLNSHELVLPNSIINFNFLPCLSAGQTINLTDDIQRFTDVVYQHAKQSGMYRETMLVTCEYCKRREITDMISPDKKAWLKDCLRHPKSKSRKDKSKDKSKAKTSSDHNNNSNRRKDSPGGGNGGAGASSKSNGSASSGKSKSKSQSQHHSSTSKAQHSSTTSTERKK